MVTVGACLVVAFVSFTAGVVLGIHTVIRDREAEQS